MVTIIARTREELIEQLDLYNVPHDEDFDRMVDLIYKIPPKGVIREPFRVKNAGRLDFQAEKFASVRNKQ